MARRRQPTPQGDVSNQYTQQVETQASGEGRACKASTDSFIFCSKVIIPTPYTCGNNFKEFHELIERMAESFQMHLEEIQEATHKLVDISHCTALGL